MTNLDTTFRLGVVDDIQERNRKYAHIISKQVARQMGSPEVREKIKKTVDEMLLAEVNRVAARIAAKAIKDSAANLPPSGPTVKDILWAVCEASGLSMSDLLGPWRPRKFARARQMGYALMRSLRPDLSFPAIGRVFGGKDHGTVMSGIKVFEEKKAEGPIVTWLCHPAIVALGEGK